MREKEVTKILFIDDDETSFQFRKCMAQVLRQLPPVELFHAGDATEGLQLLEKVHPDVVVLDDELCDECDLFLDSLTLNHPPVVVQVDGKQKTKTPAKHVMVNYIRKNESLAGIHDTLLAATIAAGKQEKGVAQ